MRIFANFDSIDSIFRFDFDRYCVRGPKKLTKYKQKKKKKNKKKKENKNTKRFDIPFDSIDIASEGHGGPPWPATTSPRKNKDQAEKESTVVTKFGM